MEEIYKECGQEHLLSHLNSLDEEKKKKLTQNLKRLQEKIPIVLSSFSKSLEQSTETPKPFQNVNKPSKEQTEKWWKFGLEKISQGQVAAVLLAGGQGTRLGTTLPKGIYDFGLESGKCLYQLQAERILKIQKLAAETFPENKFKSIVRWYIMTSDSTDIETKLFFEKHNYFNFDKEHIIFFQQDMVPCLSENSKIMLSDETNVAQNPNGNGGVYMGLREAGLLEEMEALGISSVFCYSVDNVLVKVVDPVFVGQFYETNVECSIKVVPKLFPSEPLGVLVEAEEGRAKIVEYSELSQELANARRPPTKEGEEGELLFNEGNVCIHLFSLSFIKRITESPLHLPFHLAKKTTSVYNPETRLTETQTCWKLEHFIFDVFVLAHSMSALRVSREEEFSPLKNSDKVGKDCPTTCRTHLKNLAKIYLKRAGATIENEDEYLEISPYLSYAGEGLEKYRNQTVHLPAYLQ